MEVTVNGKRQSLREGMTLVELVSELGLEGKPVAVELNLDVVPRARFHETALRDGDRLEIVTLVGGG